MNKMSNIYDDNEFFQAYAQMDRSKDGLNAAGEWYQLKLMFPDLQGKTVLDLGCGYGWHCKYAIDLGAKEVLGIDISNKMLDKAKQLNKDEHIKYQRCKIEEYNYPENTYDFVISNLALHYIEDLEFIYKKVYQTLKTNGCFLFNIEHPSFTAGINQDWIYDKNGKPLYWPIDHYYEPGQRVTTFLGHKVVKQHHTLTQILNVLIKSGFQLETVEEVVPSNEMINLYGLQDEIRRPMMLLVKAKKL